MKFGDKEHMRYLNKFKPKTMKTKAEILEAKYLKNNGALCPFCNSSNITAGETDADGDIIWQPVRCIDCGEEWDEMYELKSVTFLKFEK